MRYNLLIWGEDKDGFWKARWSGIDEERANNILMSYEHEGSEAGMLDYELDPIEELEIELETDWRVDPE